MKNILLMGLSTFKSGRIDRWTMRDADGNGHAYYYQMEPVLIYLSRELEKNNEKIDAIVAMVTDKANVVADRLFEDGNMIKNGRYSPISYLKARYPEIDIIPVHVDVNDMSGGIVSSARTLRSFNEADEEFKLWIDNHGSLREIPMIMQGIISLLEREGLKPESVFGCETDNARKSARVILADESYKINDFVSGMNEFLNSGKATQLAKYLEGDENKEIADLIAAISDAILLCDMVAFDDSCMRLATWLENREDDGSYWDLFAEYIKADYGKLLDVKTGILSKIKWCLEKDYIQQALTLIESKMPEQIYNTYIVCDNSNETIAVYDENEHEVKALGKKKIKDRIEYAKPAWENKANYLVMKYAYALVVDMDKDENAVFTELSEASMAKLTEKMNINSFDKVNNPLSKDGILHFKLQVTKGRADNHVDIAIKYKKDLDTYPAFCEFIKLHMALKNQRNNANHGAAKPGETRVKVGDVKNAIKTYIDFAVFMGMKL